MTIRLNSFVLSDSIIERMGYHLERSRSIGLEHGFVLCSEHTSDGDILTDSGHCIGTKCELIFEAACKKKHERVVGSYHTHPRGTSLMSDIDMKTSCDHEIACVGGGKDNRITCFVTKKHIDKNECKAQADISLRKNIPHQDESQRIAVEKEAFSKIAEEHMRKIATSMRYSREIEEENKRLKKLQDELNARIYRNNYNVGECLKFRNEIINKYFDTYNIK